VLNASEGGIGLFTESVPQSELLEIQPENSNLRISVSAKHCTRTSAGTSSAAPFSPRRRWIFFMRYRLVAGLPPER